MWSHLRAGSIKAAEQRLWSALGDQAEQFAQKMIRDPDYPVAVASVLSEASRNGNLGIVLLDAYALSFNLVANELIKLMLPRLSEVEREYMEVIGPKIVSLRFRSATERIYGGSPEAREAEREARKLEEASSMKLTEAGVSSNKQKLLSELLYAADDGFLSMFPPKSITNILFHMNETLNKGMLREMELVATVVAPGKIQIFLDCLLRTAEQLKRHP